MISVPLMDYLFTEPTGGDLLLPLHQRMFEVMRYLYKEKQNYGLVAGFLYTKSHIKNQTETEPFL